MHRNPQDHLPAGLNYGDLSLAVRATTDVTSLFRLLVETYREAAVLERDITEIQNYYAFIGSVADQVHKENMLSLEQSYAERNKQVEFIERMAASLIERGQDELAVSVTMRLMDLLKESPLEKAITSRQSQLAKLHRG